MVTNREIQKRCGSDAAFEKVKNGELDLWIFGTIYYEDLLNPAPISRHETAWCIHYLTHSANVLSSFGLPGYTYHTSREQATTKARSQIRTLPLLRIKALLH